jgi:N-methylhydantoinase A
MPLDAEKSRAVVWEKVAKPLKISLEAAAEGILKVVNANMARGIRLVSVECGHDPRDFALFAFGGGGALHAVDLAKELNIPKVVIPSHPGVNSAVGLLIADFRYDYSKTYLSKFGNIQLEELNGFFLEMETFAYQQMKDANIIPDDIILSRSADIRYDGQGYEIETPIPGGHLNTTQLESVKEAFDTMHHKLYGYRQANEEKEMVYLRLAAIGRVKKPELYRQPRIATAVPIAFKERRSVFIDDSFVETLIYERAELKSGNRINGPAIIEQMDTTILIKKGQAGVVDEHQNLVVRV